jgi:uracil-DNA glycosylase family 4
MGKGILTVEEEVKEIMGHLKNHMGLNESMGLEPPRLSPQARAYLDGGPSQPISLEDLREDIGDCRRCKLYQDRTTLVFGEGSSKARLVFVGEGPGREEDQVGRPFVGEAGRLLTRIIEAMGLSRESVYICNVVKCRPPKNRDPEGDEIESCLPFLKRQLNLIQPDVICALGRVAAQTLLGMEFRITQERGKWHSFMDIPMMPTFHPAYLLRNPTAKREVWEDIQEIMRHLGMEVKRDG